MQREAVGESRDRGKLQHVEETSYDDNYDNEMQSGFGDDISGMGCVYVCGLLYT